MTNRGLFTEEFTSKRLERVFGTDKVFRNVEIWDKARKNRLGEIDTLVLIGDRALVVQAKSKKLTIEAQKGNDLQLQADFKGAIQDACDQALACSHRLLEGEAKFLDPSGNDVILLNAIKDVYPICVVSDHYPALSFQARQFLKAATTDAIRSPLVCDVFLIDVVTEFLNTPLRFLSYLELRAKAGDGVMSSHEITAFGYHLKRNLWLGEYDFMLLEDDISVDVDIAMAARRDGIEGQRTPPGILTELRDTAIGRIINEIEQRSEAGAIAVGLELLKLSGKSARDLSGSIDRIAAAAADGKEHDVTVAKRGESGITFHCNSLPDLVSAPKLRRHCELRKFGEKAPVWFGLTLEPVSGAIRFGLVLDFPWQQDADMQVAVARMPAVRPAEALREFARSGTRRRKIGRNEICPCGSGLKYKKCHLEIDQRRS